MKPLRLGINIDHVATVRNARGGTHPEPLRAALLAKQAGADSIVAHLREDRRHVREDDIRRIHETVGLPLTFEMAATPEMLGIALSVKPHAVCLVPERRAELTTEGGLNAASMKPSLAPMVERLQEAGILVSLFIDPDERQLEASAEIAAKAVEIHTGRYCETTGEEQRLELERIRWIARLTQEFGLQCHGGHGLNYTNVGAIAAIPEMEELNIGHFLIGEAIFVGLEASIREMRRCMDEPRSKVLAV